jgi:4-hydroxymandelate oxidase
MSSEWLVSLEAEAESVIGDDIYNWIAGGAGTESVLARNREGWARTLLKPDALVDVSHVDTSTMLLGERFDHPIGIAPSGFHGLSHGDSERATARGAAESAALMVLSSRSSLRLEEVAPALDRWWFQSYIYKDRAITESMVRRASMLGARAVVLTVDAPVLPRRRRGRDSSLVGPDVFQVNSGRVDDLSRLEQAEDVTGHDIEWLSEISRLPVVVKGILRGDTARRSVEAGASAVWVSNHGGRQLDAAQSTAEALGPIVDSVGQDTEVYVDGGVCNGLDVVRACAIGARAVFVGRAPIWGLVVGGASGVEGVISRLREELIHTLQLCGRPSLSSVSRDLVASTP